MESVECGAASLGIILGYFGRWIPLEQLRTDCGVSRNGSNARHIAEAARNHGLDCKGMKAEPSDLPTIPLPVIVFWNYNHFLVVEGVSTDWVYINDPESGPRRITWDDFDRSFSGILLKFEKGPSFERKGSPPSAVRGLFERMRGNTLNLLFVFLTSLALVAPGIVAPAFIRIFIDDILTNGNVSWILALLIAMIVTIAMSAGLTWLQQYFIARMETGLALLWSGRLFWHVLRLPMSFYMQRFSGDIASRVELNDGVAQMVSGRLVSAMLNLLMLAFYGMVMYSYSALLTGITVALALSNGLLLIYTGRVRTDLNRRLAQSGGKLSGCTFSGLQMMDSLKASGREGDLYARWSGYQAQVLSSEQELGVTAQLLSTMPSLTMNLGNVFILTIGAVHVLEGSMSVGMLVAFMSLVGSFLAPVNMLLEYAGDIQRSMGDLSRIDDVLRNPADPWGQDGIAPDAPKRLSGHLELRGLTFGYSHSDPPLIENFNLVVKPGQRVALVGGTGSGKSTIGKMIGGLYQPWGGEILFDGVAREKISREVITSGLGYVDQEIVLFDGSIRDNLTLWNPAYDDETLVRALRDASLEHEILDRVGGLDSTIREGGSDLSGGQRQRLEIARALALEPAIMVLDEATSALDALVERNIDARLRARGITCVIIAHRLSTIRDCDEIIVLDHGRVLQRGTHDKLIKQEGAPYWELIQAETAANAAAVKTAEGGAGA
ncbi:MAG: NHLP family bacteriocin export ABC transporter peptidase/permease/ATPase subunit [Proteobacteria bacterium]|nr:NHLP family bacteriocin export ABC transporter peptidase/permease/ATPase subunit [Pseudomonadota bacterium]